MLVMHIVESFSAGVYKYINQIVNHLPREQYSHLIVHSIDKLTPQYYQKEFQNNVKFIYISMDKGINIREDIKVMRLVKEIVSFYQPQVIHLHSSKAGFIGRLAVSSRKTKLLYTPHGYSFIMKEKSYLLLLLFYLCEFFLSNIRKSKTIACSETEFKHAQRIHLFSKPLLVRNGTTIDRNNQLGTKKEVLILGVGRLEIQKNPELFVKVIALIKKKHPNVKGVWIGEGQLRDKCIKLNEELQAQVVFKGLLPQQDVYTYMLNSRILIQPSKWEGLPFTIIEALSIGLPVIASDIDSHREIIEDGHTGFLANNEEDYVTSIDKVLSNEQFSNMISQKAKTKHSVMYSREVFIEKLNELYNDPI